MRFFLAFTISFLMWACSTSKTLRPTQTIEVPESKKAMISKASIPSSEVIKVVKNENVSALVVDDSTFVNLYDYSHDFIYKMKYASEDNFLKTKVYNCEACYLRYKTVKALLKAQEKFMKKGYRIVLFDCYRPLDIQKKMWQIVPNPSYVADPKKGSIHNRGGAVDISLADINGNELDMGTGFDHFGPEAAQDYENLPESVLENRKLLRNTMIRAGFRIFESEWWHYNLKNARREPISNFQWICD
ncbi:MAG: M15 family metallopeptidase [Flavobacteriaceae bacterium]